VTFPRILIAAVVAIVVIAAAAGAGWWFFVREDNELATNAPAIPSDLTPSSTTTPSNDPPASGQTYVVVPERSEAAYFADEKLAALPLPSTAKGSTTDIEGQFHLTDDGLALDPSRESKFTVDLTTLRSDQDRRDNQVQGRGLETATYPTATFVVTSITGYDAAIAEGEEQMLQMTGMMDLHGVQKELTWDVKARRQDDVITGLATVNFRYEDFNIPVLTIAGIVTVEEDVTLQVTIVAQRT
jgi:polyisoprenoid-binding protein YceI